MDDALFGKRDKRGDWKPSKLIAYPPVFVWPAEPLNFLRWLFGYPGFILPWNLFYGAVGVVLWLYQCNYADGAIPLDKWFGTFHDGSLDAQERMDKRFIERARRQAERQVRHAASTK